MQLRLIMINKSIPIGNKVIKSINARKLWMEAERRLKETRQTLSHCFTLHQLSLIFASITLWIDSFHSVLEFHFFCIIIWLSAAWIAFLHAHFNSSWQRQISDTTRCSFFIWKLHSIRSKMVISDFVSFFKFYLFSRSRKENKFIRNW